MSMSMEDECQQASEPEEVDERPKPTRKACRAVAPCACRAREQGWWMGVQGAEWRPWTSAGGQGEGQGRKGQGLAATDGWTGGRVF